MVQSGGRRSNVGRSEAKGTNRSACSSAIAARPSDLNRRVLTKLRKWVGWISANVFVHLIKESRTDLPSTSMRTPRRNSSWSASMLDALGQTARERITSSTHASGVTCASWKSSKSNRCSLNACDMMWRA